MRFLEAEPGARPWPHWLPKPAIAPGGVRGSPNLAGLTRDADLVLIAVPPAAVREVIRASRPGPRSQVVIAARGLDISTGSWLTDIITEESPCLQVGALAGPALAAEVMRRQPSAQVIASEFDAVCQTTQRALHSAICRVYTSDDLRGVELAGAMVSVLTVAMGIADAMKQGIGVRGVIVTRGLAEASRLGGEATPIIQATPSGALSDRVVQLQQVWRMRSVQCCDWQPAMAWRCR